MKVKPDQHGSNITKRYGRLCLTLINGWSDVVMTQIILVKYIADFSALHSQCDQFGRNFAILAKLKC